MPTALSVLRVLSICAGGLYLIPVTLASSVTVAGHWEGTMVREGASLEVSFDFSTSGAQPKGTFTSVTQQAMGYPLNVVTISADEVHFALGDSLVFDGKLASDQIVGTFNDDGAVGRFVLHRGVPEVLPYDGVDVIFRNGAVALSGTLCMPRSPGRHAAVVILQGSGGESRWGTNRFIADQFARSGIAALVYDKRGSGVSTATGKLPPMMISPMMFWRESTFWPLDPILIPDASDYTDIAKVESSRRLLRFMLPPRSLL